MKRFLHDLSHIHSLSLDMGYLVPLAAIDVLPGDTFISRASILARVAPLATPVMHPVEIRVHNWFVPNRIIWDEWEEFIVGNEGAATYPTVTPAAASDTVVIDHMGIEPVTGVPVDELPIRAYNMIWNEFYRDQDLSAARAEDDLSLAKVAWGKDYFTTARANPQQGAAVEVAFSSGQAPLKGIAVDNSTADGGFTETDGATGTYSEYLAINRTAKSAGATNDVLKLEMDATTPTIPAFFADLSQATGGIDINSLRDAIALQRIAEARNFYGSRYVDFLRWYGVNPRDGRLDRPEYLGGGRQMISFSEVLATAEGASTDVGDLFGHGIAGVRQRPFRKMFEEHGWFISVMFVRPKGIYQNGIPRRFLRTQPEDFWHREFELLPWQSVSELEIFGGGSAANVFGYVPRYDEYREVQSFVSGTFRGGTEEDWTLAREFASAPTLNESFVTCTPSDRIYSDTSMPEILATAKLDITAKRLVAPNARMSNRAGI